MKVALIYDRLNKVGGAEQVLQAFHELFPEGVWYTSVWDPTMTPFTRSWEVHRSWISRLPYLRRRHEWIPFLMPFIFESFDLSEYDLVVSIGSAECKGVITLPTTCHIHYCLTPTRYLYSHVDTYIKNAFQRKCAHILRQWDKVASQRPDEMISISEQVKKRVQKYYDRETDVIYPPVDTKKFTKLPSYQDPTLLRDYYLIVSRLVPYKNIELAIRACNDLGRELVIVGTGSAERELKKIAGPTVHFMGFLSDQQVVAYMSRCRAYIQCNEEDFGIAMVEAQAAGRPVIAYNRGGATDIVRERTGVLYNELTVHALSGAIIASEKTRFISADCQRNAARFDKVKWLRTMKERIMKSCQTKKN